MTREIILDFAIPQSVLVTDGHSLSEEDINKSRPARREVNRVIRVLRSEKVLKRGDNITANLHIDQRLSSQEPVRKVDVIQIFREDPNGKGAIDGPTETHFVGIKPRR